MKLHFFLGVDGQGDACLYLQILDEDSAHVRFASEAEVERLAEMLTEKADDCASPDEFSNLLDVCKLERVA